MSMSSFTSIPMEETEAFAPSHIPPAPWMPLEPLTELWSAFGREATSPAAVLAASRAFAALADEREAVHILNWLAPARLPVAPQASAIVEASLFSRLVAHEGIIEALSRAATHWYEAARALLDVTDQPSTDEDEEQAVSFSSDLEALIGYTLSQRLRVWAIAHSLLADHLQQLFPGRQQEGGQTR
ncbi:MAG TPA: hypothetical protein VIZ18_00790 [Ktedonobacteraceae bacterium]